MIFLVRQTIFGSLVKFSSYPRLIFANARSSLKFYVSYIASTIVWGLLLTFRLFQGYSLGVFLIYSHIYNHRISWFEFVSSYSSLKSYLISCVGLLAIVLHH